MEFEDILSFVPNSTHPKSSSKIYFAGNKEEFELYFDTISKQILNYAQKCNTTCTIWFRKDFDSFSSEENQLLFDFLSETHLIVVPITRNLLLSANGVMQNEIRFAKKSNKPILPIMLESGLVELYSRPENFENRQFLNPYENDATAIPYEKKLQDYLSVVLLNDEIRKKIQQAFDAYIFLSYRKKDRAEAQKLMHLIHQNDFCRDVAIWYDEYLIPGEDFNAVIQDALQKSDLFALMVTPHVVEPNNYVVKHEYPMAQELSQQKKLSILPIECVKTDEEVLQSMFQNIPPCTMAYDCNMLSDALESSLKNVALMKNQDNPNHNYLIGLAYLNGIDVEIDYEKAMKLISDAANADLPEAKKKLMEIYQNGIGISIQYQNALYWSDKLIEQYKVLFQSDETFGAQIALECIDKISLLTLMGEATRGEEAALEAIYYCKYLPMPQSVEKSICLYMALANIREKKKSSEYPFENQLANLHDIKMAGLSSLIKAEELAFIHQDIPELAKLITFLLVGIYSLYVNIGNKEKMAEYHLKVTDFCKKYHSEGLAEFEKICKLDALNQSIDWSNLDGVREYLDHYFSVVEENEISENKPGMLMPFAVDFSDVIAFFMQQGMSSQDLSCFEPYVHRFISIFEKIPLKEAGNDVLAIRTRLYTVVADFERLKGNQKGVFHIMDRCTYVAKEIFMRNANQTNRTLYFDITLATANVALQLDLVQTAFRMTKEAYDVWKANCEGDSDETSLRVKADIYSNFAQIFQKQDKQEDAIAFYESATKATIDLCNAYFNVNNISRVAEAYNNFSGYQYQKGNYESAIFLCEECLKTYQIFFDYRKKRPQLFAPTHAEDHRFAFEYQRCISYLAGACHETKQYEKEAVFRGMMGDLEGEK